MQTSMNLPTISGQIDFFQRHVNKLAEDVRVMQQSVKKKSRDVSLYGIFSHLKVSSRTLTNLRKDLSTIWEDEWSTS